MSNLWRIKQSIMFNPDSVVWPAILQAELVLDPADYFERKTQEDAVTSISGETKFDLDRTRAKLKITATGIAPPVKVHVVVENGHVDLIGNRALVMVKVESLDHAAAFIDSLNVMLSQFLSVETGLFCDVRTITGKIADQDFSISYPGLAYSILVNESEPGRRLETLTNALKLVDVNSQSYARFVTCCLYYQHALRFLSPYEVSFPEFTALPEIILNLSKCIELLFTSKDRKELTHKLLKVGFTEDQIRSQLMSIIIIRNQLDVGHVTSGVIDVEEIGVLRNFANRSVGNVRTLLITVAEKIRIDPAFLAPLSRQMSKEKQSIIKTLRVNLELPALKESIGQIFITAKVTDVIREPTE